MVRLEAQEFAYFNGIYAGDLFVTREGRHKQRDWNIRRGGRSAPESMTLFGMSNYETKAIIALADIAADLRLSNIDLFRLYTQICRRLLDDYGMYIISSGFGYCSRDDRESGGRLKFNVLVHPKWLVQADKKGVQVALRRCDHRERVTEIVKEMTMKILRTYQCESSC
jgi:hypothetical protein